MSHTSIMTSSKTHLFWLPTLFYVACSPESQIMLASLLLRLDFRIENRVGDFARFCPQTKYA